ncbi:MAG: hypothetical protein ACI3XP_06870 [Eubacteriales bacterium]
MNHLSVPLLALLLSLLLLAGCSAEESPDLVDFTAKTIGTESTSAAAGGDTSAAAETAETEGFSLTYQGVRLTPGALADIQSLLGEPDDMLEAPSCVHDGSDILYFYDGVEIVTMPSDSGEQLYSISITADSVTTEEGLSIGMTGEDALRMYGDGTEAFGQYLFVRGKTSLQVMTDGDGAVTSITYVYIP